MKFLFCATLLFLASISILPAQILILDFGPTTTLDADKTNLPYNTGISSSASFNTITAAAATSGLTFADGTSDSSLSLTFGGGNGSVANFPLGNNPGTGPGHVGYNPGLTGSGNSTGIYAGTSAARDGFFVTTDSGGGGQTTLGVSIGGLAAGTYDIFLGGKNTNSGATSEAFFSTVTSATPATQDTSSLIGATVTNTGTTSFIQGNNYVELTETITAGQSLNIYATGLTTSTDERAFLNYAEIVSVATVPEPQSYVLLATGLFALLFVRRYLVSRRA
jgi:hypothetical protein